jgi:hypothetical protein
MFLALDILLDSRVPVHFVAFVRGVDLAARLAANVTLCQQELSQRLHTIKANIKLKKKIICVKPNFFFIQIKVQRGLRPYTRKKIDNAC